MADELDPRQDLFLKYYLDPKSETFGSGSKSALKAGYSETYAKTILDRENEWIDNRVSHEKLVKKAERNLDKFLDEAKEERNKVDVSKFVVSRLDKKNWAERRELSGEDGKPLIIQVSPEIAEKNKLNANAQPNTSTSEDSQGQP